jgi:hypothetical protein
MRVRVHVYERSFPEEPNNAFSVGATAVDTAFDTGRRTRRWHEERGVCRTTKTCIWGRERPPKTGRGTVIGGWQRGSLTPPDASSLVLATALAGHGRRKAPPVRQRPELAHRKEHRRIHPSRDQLELCASLAADQRAKQGDNCSETGCPPPLLDAEFVTGLPGERNLARRLLRS